MSLTISDAAKNSLQISKQGIMLVRLYYGGETNYLTISSAAFPNNSSWAEEEYRPLLPLPIPSDFYKVDMFTHRFSAAEIKLQVINGDYHPDVKFSDLVSDISLGSGNDIGLDNRKAEIRLWAPGLTKWSDCLQLRDGRIRDIAHTFTGMVFSIQDRREIIHIDIGTLLTDSDAANTVIGLPQESAGKIGPKVYGDHRFFIMDTDETLATISRRNTMPPAVALGPDSAGDFHWMLADHQLDTIKSIWGLDSTIRRHVELSASTQVTNDNTDGAVYKHGPWYDLTAAAGVEAYDSWFPTQTIIQNVLWVNPTRAADGLFDGASSFASADTAQIITDVPETGTLEIEFEDWDNTSPDAEIIGVAVFVRTHYEITAGTITDAYTINGQDAEANGTTATIYVIDNPPATRAGIFENVIAIYDVSVDGGGAATIVRLYEIYKRIQYVPKSALPIYTDVLGREYGATRGGHDEAVNGTAIQNPIGSIESIYNDELGASDIDTAGFDTASVVLTGWKFAFWILDLTPSLPFIGNMGRECKSFVHLKPDNEITIDALANTYTASDRTVDFKDIINPRFTRTSPNNLYTAVEVRYGLTFDGKYNSTTGISEDTAMQAKYNLSQAESLLIFKSQFINESATALLLQTFLLNQWKQLHNIITFEASLKYIDQDIGDIIEFDNVPSNIKAFGLDITQNNTIAGQIIYKYWFIFSVKRSINGITIKAFQLHDLS